MDNEKVRALVNWPPIDTFPLHNNPTRSLSFSKIKQLEQSYTQLASSRQETGTCFAWLHVQHASHHCSCPQVLSVISGLPLGAGPIISGPTSCTWSQQGQSHSRTHLARTDPLRLSVPLGPPISYPYCEL